MRNETINLLNGPVDLSARVLHAFHEEQRYHRSDWMRATYRQLNLQLGDLVGGNHACAIVPGSGTCANDACAAAIRARFRSRRGLIVANGEFGRRLVDIAHRWRLRFDTYDAGWAQPIDWHEVANRAQRLGRRSWLWLVKHETSAGRDNDASRAMDIASEYAHEVIVDAVSAVATGPLDLERAWLVSGSSGKAVGAVAGLAMVWVRRPLVLGPSSDVPTHLDLARYLDVDEPPCTVSSSLVAALAAAIDERATRPDLLRRARRIAAIGDELRQAFATWGMFPLTSDREANSGTLTLVPPSGTPADECLARLRQVGVAVGGDSRYLRERGLIQVSAIGCVDRDGVRDLAARLQRAFGRQHLSMTS